MQCKGCGAEIKAKDGGGETPYYEVTKNTLKNSAPYVNIADTGIFCKKTCATKFLNSV